PERPSDAAPRIVRLELPSGAGPAARSFARPPARGPAGAFRGTRRPGPGRGGGAVGKKVYVGDLAVGGTGGQLRGLFTPDGSVQLAQLITDRDTGRSKGFGFVEMGSDQEAQAAITGMNGQMVDGRPLTVNEAKPKEDRGGRGGYGGGGGGRGGYGG